MADATAGKVLYLVLLRMGFVRISALAGMERALTSPFHPYRRLLPRRESTGGGLLSVALSPDHSGPPLAAILSLGVRTFLSPSMLGERCSILSVRTEL